MNIGSYKNSAAILFRGVIAMKTPLCIIRFCAVDKRFAVNCFSIFDKSDFRQAVVQNKESFGDVSAIRINIRDHAQTKRCILDVIIKLGNDIAAEVLVAAQALNSLYDIIAHSSDKIAFKSTLRFFACRSIEICAARFSRKHYLESINDR